VTEDPRAAEPAQRTTVVTGTRSRSRLTDATVATEVITRTQIQESGSRTVSEALRATPGVEVVGGYAGASVVRMQGLGPEYNLVIVDGQRATGRVEGAINLNRYSSEDIQQIEIVKGPSSVLWGSDAMAGVIQLVTRRPEKTLGGDAQVSYGEFNQLDARASLEGRAGESGLRGSVAFQRRDAIRDDPGTIFTNSSEFRTLEGTTRYTYGDVRGEGAYVDVRLAGSLRDTAGVDVLAGGAIYDYSTGTRLLENSSLVRLKAGAGTLTLNLGGSIWKERYVNDHRGVTSNDRVEDSLDRNGLLSAVYALPLGAHELIGGVDLFTESIDTAKLVVGHKDHRERASAFLQDEWRLSAEPRVVGAAGVRVDVDSEFGTVLTPRLAVRYDPVEALALRASVGTGFRAPSFQELYFNLDHAALGYRVDGNPNLKPEHSVGATLAADWRPVRSVSVSGSLFWNQLWDMIAYTFDYSNPTLIKTSYGNTARATTRGGEVSAAWDTSRFLTVGAGYTYTYARDLDTGLELDQQATHRIVGQLRGRVRELGLSGFVRAAWTSRTPYVDGEAGTTVYAPAFVMLDARAGWKVPHTPIELFASGNNLLKSASFLGTPLARRAFFAGASATF
jgi:outer membrane receptor for ferrienterochelin and colicins